MIKEELYNYNDGKTMDEFIDECKKENIKVSLKIIRLIKCELNKKEYIRNNQIGKKRRKKMTEEQFEYYGEPEEDQENNNFNIYEKPIIGKTMNRYIYTMTNEIISCDNCKYYEDIANCMHDDILNSDLPKIIHHSTCGLFEEL